MKKIKNYLITLAGIALFGAGFYILREFPEPIGIMKTLPYICVGIGCGLFGNGVSSIVTMKALEKDPKMAKQMEIEAKDERNVSHGNAAKAKGFDMMTFVFGALLLAYALMNVSMGVIISLVIAYLFVEFYAVYRRIKIDKED